MLLKINISNSKNSMMRLLLCFMPILVIFLALKLVILAEESGREVNYVNEESKKPHGPYVDAYPEEEDPWDED